MIQSLLMFLAPAQSSQAKPISPPALVRSAEPLLKRGLKPGKDSLRFCASVLGNSVGFGAIFAASWFSIQLMQVWLG